MENIEIKKKKLLSSWILVVSIALIVRAAGNIFLPSISYMAKDLNVDEAVATSNLNLYYIILAICYILLGPVCDRYRKSFLLRLGLLVCVAGCVIAAVATNIHVLNVGRSIQALAAGLCMLSSQLWISEHSDKKDMMKQLAWFSMVAALAPLLAPFLGGFIADWLSWRYDFWLIVLLGIPVYIFTSNLKKMDSPSTDNKKSISIKSVFNNYKDVLLDSPLEKLSVSVQVLFWGQSCFITISSFLFIDEFGISATQLGVLNFLFVAGLVAGRFPVVYLQRKYSIRCAFTVMAILTIITSAAMLTYYFIAGTHDLIEIVLIYSFQNIAFGGLAILGVRNCIVVGEENKGSATGFFHFSTQFFSWLGVAFAQYLYSLDFSSVEILQCQMSIVLLFSLAGLLLFLHSYSRNKNRIE